MDKINNQRKKLIIAITLLIIIILGLGITYAWLIQIVNGEKIQSMRVGTFRFSLTEENSLTINSGEFLKDSDGLKQEGFKFTVQNVGKGYGSYSVYLDDDSISSGQTRIDDKFIRYSLGVNADTTGTPTNLTSRKIYSGGLDSKGKDTFTLRLWLNPAVNGDIGGQVFKAKLRIEANQEVSNEQATTITYDYNYLVNDKFDEYYDTSVFYPCCETAISLTKYETYYDDVGRVFFVTANKNKGDRGWFFPNKKALTIEKTYTYIFEARSSVALTAKIGSEQEGNSDFNIASNYKRYTKTFKAKNVFDGNNYYRAFIFYDWTDTNDRTIEIRNLQIQEGKLSTSDVVKKNNTKFGELLYLKRDNYQFLGWYTDPINGDKIDENTIVPNTDTTYYAHWKYIGEK